MKYLDASQRLQPKATDKKKDSKHIVVNNSCKESISSCSKPIQGTVVESIFIKLFYHILLSIGFFLWFPANLYFRTPFHKKIHNIGLVSYDTS